MLCASSRADCEYLFDCSIDGLISISDIRTKKIDLDQFVMPTTERGRNMSLKRFGF